MRIVAERPLVLGSASPRRRELLALAGVPFAVRAVATDESTRPGEAARAYLERVTLAKLSAVRADGPLQGFGFEAEPNIRAPLLVADTIVVAPDGRVLGKPRDDDDAHFMIASLSGKEHQVWTRYILAILSADDSSPPFAHAETVCTTVTFRPLTAGDVKAYVACGEGRDKAGAYAVQGRGAALVARIDGSYTNVVGLPLCQVVVALRTLGWLEEP